MDSKLSIYSTSILLLLTLGSLNHVMSSYSYPSGKKASHPSGHLKGKTGKCNTENDSDCCKAGKLYHKCSPSWQTKSMPPWPSTVLPRVEMAVAHRNEMVVALSTGWYNHGSRCMKKIKIHANRNTVEANVVDECDSMHGCDDENDYQPPCRNNIVDASPGVWKKLGIPNS